MLITAVVEPEADADLHAYLVVLPLVRAENG
jgi:hypothetical protein